MTRNQRTASAIAIVAGILLAIGLGITSITGLVVYGIVDQLTEPESITDRVEVEVEVQKPEPKTRAQAPRQGNQPKGRKAQSPDRQPGKSGQQPRQGADRKAHAKAQR